MGRTDGWVGQVGGYVRVLGSLGMSGKQVGQVGLVWFGLDGSEFKTIRQSINDKGGHRAARVTKKTKNAKTSQKFTLDKMASTKFPDYLFKNEF